VLYNGRIVKSGDRQLALELEQKGYGWLGIPNGTLSPAAVAGAESVLAR
jgi:Fe-S cluster assembly ATP-binding protein